MTKTLLRQRFAATSKEKRFSASKYSWFSYANFNIWKMFLPVFASFAGWEFEELVRTQADEDVGLRNVWMDGWKDGTWKIKSCFVFLEA